MGTPIIVSKLSEVPWFAIGCVRGPKTSKAHLNEMKGKLGIRKTVNGMRMFFANSLALGMWGYPTGGVGGYSAASEGYPHILPYKR